MFKFIISLFVKTVVPHVDTTTLRYTRATASDADMAAYKWCAGITRDD